MLLETLSTNLTKALTQGNSTATLPNQNSGQPLGIRVGPPTMPLADGTTPDGVVKMGEGGDNAPNRVLLMPYGDGLPGSPFWMQVFGWRSVVPPNTGNQPFLWVPVLLGSFACVLGDLGGPGPAPTGYPISETERLCDSQGVGYPDSYVVDVLGSRFLTFDFQQGAPSDAPVGMNCLYARV